MREQGEVMNRSVSCIETPQISPDLCMDTVPIRFWGKLASLPDKVGFSLGLDVLGFGVGCVGRRTCCRFSI